jgi:hypothetical protein
MNKREKPERKPYERPEVVTYDRNELVPDTVFTQNNGSDGRIFSDRNLKKNVRRMDSRTVLAHLTRRGQGSARDSLGGGT